MKQFILTIRHDNGKTQISTFADTYYKAVSLVMASEGCPESAIIKVYDNTGTVHIDSSFGKRWILTQKRAGYSSDSIYRGCAERLGLFNVAFFGHKGKPGDRAKLSRLWNRIVSVNQ